MTRPSLRPLATSALVLLGLLLGSLGTSAIAAGHGVAIRDTSFSPATITIKVGDRITWTNRGSTRHNVTFDSFASVEQMDPGATFAHTFQTAGTFQYTCTLHAFNGKVVVKGAVATTAKPTATASATEAPGATPTPATTAASPSPSPAAVASIPAASPSGGTATPEPIGASSSGVPLLLLIVLVGAVAVGLVWRLSRRER